MTRLVIIILILFIGCKNDKNNILKPNQVKLLTDDSSKIWSFTSFKVDGIEKLAEFNSDSCNLPVKFNDNDDQTFVGYLSNFNCGYGGSWFFIENGEKLELSFSNTNYIGMGPWTAQTTLPFKYDILKLSEEELKLSINHSGVYYELSFKPL